MAEIERLFGADYGRSISSEPLDRMVSEDGWLCPVRIDEGCTAAAYDRDNDVITMPPKFRFNDDGRFTVRCSGRWHARRESRCVLTEESGRI